MHAFDDFGDIVKKDEPMLTIYSPEMLATQQEYLLALKSRNIMKGSPLRSSLEELRRLQGPQQPRAKQGCGDDHDDRDERDGL